MVPVFEQKKVVSLFVVLAYFGLALLGLLVCYALRDLIPPFLVAAMVALTLTPEVDRLERQGLFGKCFPRGLAIGVIYALFLGLCVIIVKGLALVSGQMEDLFRLVPHALYGSPHDATLYVANWMAAHHVPLALRAPVVNQARHLG